MTLVSCLGPKAWSWNTMLQGRTFQAWSQVWEDTWKSMGAGGYAEQFNSIKTLGERESYDWQERGWSAMAARLGVESWGLCSSIWTEGLNICMYLYKCAGLYPWNDGHNDDMMMTTNIYCLWVSGPPLNALHAVSHLIPPTTQWCRGEGETSGCSFWNTARQNRTEDENIKQEMQ